MSTLSSFSQPNNETYKLKISITARSYGDSIYLRWVVIDPTAWRLVKENGLILERAKVLSNGKVNNYIKLSTEPIKPWSDDKWREYFENRTERSEGGIDNEGIAYLLGIGEKSDEDNIQLPPENEDFLKSIKEKRSSQEWALLLTLIAANNSRLAAEGLGLFYVDNDVKENETYSYRIYSNYRSSLYEFDTTYFTIKNEKFDSQKYYQTLSANENDRSIEIIWKTDLQFSTYNIERSEDKKSYKRLNESPLLTLKSSASDSLEVDSYIDTTIINYKPYTYRVYAKTVFADEILLGEITAMGRDKTPPEQPFVLQPSHIEENKVKITWKMADPPASDLAGFYVGRDSLIDGQFKPIHKDTLSKFTREFIDTTFSRNGYNFYIVTAFDTAGNKSFSYPVYVVLNDTTPPAPPKWKEAFMDSNRIVTLRLEPNNEFDLMGYRILTANSPDHEFSSIIESFDPDSAELKFKTEFRDTVELYTTNKFIYYRATALDNRFNESDFSDIIAVPRPDLVQPVPPVLTDAKVTEKDITLFFIPSASEDVKNHYLLRKLADSEIWDTIAILKALDSLYTDENVDPNILYHYALFAVDSSNLKSDLSFILEARPYYIGALPEISNFTINYDEKNKLAILNWDYDNISNISFVNYKSYNTQPLVRYKTITEINARTFTDNDFSYGSGVYKYAMKVYDNFGGESKLTEVKSIDIK